MEMKLFSSGGIKASSKNSSRSCKALLEAIAKVNNNNNNNGGVSICKSEELNGVVRMKIVVRKQDLKQIVEAMASAANQSSSSSSPSMPSLCVEQRLNLLKKKHLLAAKQQQNRHCSWSPVLQSIPEETLAF